MPQCTGGDSVGASGAAGLTALDRAAAERAASHHFIDLEMVAAGGLFDFAGHVELELAADDGRVKRLDRDAFDRELQAHVE